MILTTTNSIEGFRIVEYKGIITGISINEEKLSVGFSMSKYYLAVKNSIGTVKEAAFKELSDNAKKINANAVVGIKVDIESVNGSHFYVSVTGTAVSVATDK